MVSVVMATYNGERFLREQLDSIYKQTYTNIEVVVADDCSTDDTVKILEEYGKSHGLIYTVNGKNLGYSKNFEKAFSLSKGKFVAFCDQDDIWHPEKIELLTKAIGDKFLAFCDAKIVDIKGDLIYASRNRALYTKLEKNLGVKYRYFVRSNALGCELLIRRDIFAKSLPLPENMSHDGWALLIASMLKSEKYINKQLLDYRIHDKNVSGLNFMKSGTNIFLTKILKKILGSAYISLRETYRQIELVQLETILASRIL